MSLPTLPKVQKLQAASHAKAKGASTFRFYTLYDKVCRDDVLWVAYQRCRINSGAAGIDRQTFADIEQYGVQKWLDELAQELTQVGAAYGAVDFHVVRRLRQWLCKKYKVRGAGISRFSAEYLYLDLRVVRLRWIKRNFS